MSLYPASSSMSKVPATTASSSNFNAIFDKALKAYTKKTKQDLKAHHLATQLKACDSPAAVVTILQDQIDQFRRSHSGGDERLQRWLSPTINVLYAFSATLGQGIGMVFSPAQVIFAGAGVLLLAAKDVKASQDVLIDIFERIENFFRRLEVYIKVPPTPAMTDMMVKIMVEVLDILGTATKEMKQSRTKKFLKRVAGITKLDDGLKKLDKMTNEEVRMANAEVMRIAHEIDKKVEGVDENVKLVEWRQLRESFMKWQSPSDPSTNHNFACKLQHEGTTEWFCKGDVFEKWMAMGSLLWIHGKPGSGKSILCSAIINDIAALHKAGLASMAYFYFDFRDVDKQSLRDLLPSLLVQLSAHSDPFCDILYRLYEEYDHGTLQPSDNALILCLKDMLTLPDQGPVYLILDALDECSNTLGVPSFREQVLKLVKELVELRLPSLHICTTSRPEVDIQDTLASLASHSVSLHDENGQREDIAEYVRSVVYSDSVRAMRRWRDADKALVIKTLSEKADGMFRWVFCQLETLRQCLPQNIPRVLRQLPKSLDETYERVLKEIGMANRHHAYRLLQCLAVSIRPLRVEELAEILALDFDNTKDGVPQLKEDWRWKDQQEAVLSTCSSLITVVGGGSQRVVQFSHFSVKEFLTSHRLAASSAEVSHFHILPEPAHTVISKACLGILLQSGDADVGDVQTKRSSLAKYAAEYWVDHARFEKVSTHLEDGMRHLCDSAKPYFEAWLDLYDIDNGWYEFTDHSYQRRGSPLYYASLCGFRNLATHLVAEHPEHVNATLGRCLSPLVAALHNKHFSIAELLHQRGADVNVTGYRNRTPLHAALLDGLVDIAQWLLAHSADPMLRQDDYETPLHLAVRNGRLEIVQVLLTRGIIVDAKNKDDLTSLHLASEAGQVEIVRLLLRHGANTAARDRKNRTPLHLALSWSDRLFTASHEVISVAKAETVWALLKHGANVTAWDDIDRTPLHLASSMWSAETVQILLERGANVKAMDMKRLTPLHLASSRGAVETMQILLGRGADINAVDWNYSTPLHFAACSIKGTEAARLLIEKGADVNAQNRGNKPSFSPSSSESPETVRPLTEHGTEATTRFRGHTTPLHLASFTGRTETVKLLVQHGANVNAHDEGHSTPLHRAVSSRFSLDGNIDIVHELLIHGANVDDKDDSGQTAFQIASSNGLSKIAELLSDYHGK